MRRYTDDGCWTTQEIATLTDERGRVGIVSEIRDYTRGPGLFARPATMAYITRMEIPGLGAQDCITATWWARQADGTYRGCWADSPPHTMLSATVTLMAPGA